MYFGLFDLCPVLAMPTVSYELSLVYLGLLNESLLPFVIHCISILMNRTQSSLKTPTVRGVLLDNILNRSGLYSLVYHKSSNLHLTLVCTSSNAITHNLWTRPPSIHITDQAH
jgi:hypothetical protein